MSRFIDIVDSQYLKQAEPLDTGGSTCFAYRVQVNGKQQFLKRLRPEFQGNPRYVAAFTKEFMTGKMLSHDNLVRYNEMSTTSEGICMLLDYVAGDTLARRLSEQPSYFRDADNLHRFVAQLLSCLAYLHSHQVVHLDLKPDNIMLTQVGGDVKVLDLGFCYTDTYCTTTGKTDRYAAPEQTVGELGDIDARTDLYAVGCILREIEQCQDSPLPKAYRQLMNQCLAERKEDRPANASACLAMLRKRHVWRWTAVACALVVLVFLFGWFVAGGADRWKEAHQLRTAKGRPYDFVFHHVYYRILSEDSLTCEAVEWNTDSSLVDPNIMIYNEVTDGSRHYAVTSIADSAFHECTQVQSIHIPEGVTRIGMSALDRCMALGNVSLPNGVKVLNSNLFGGCHSITGIRIPESVQEVKHNCFADCFSLRSITLPDPVRVLEVDCFANDSSLVDVHLPAALEVLERGVFYNCRALPSITLPATLKSIGSYAFYLCDSLTDIYILAPLPPVAHSAFDRHDICVHVPKGCLETYQSDAVWGQMLLVEG